MSKKTNNLLSFLIILVLMLTASVCPSVYASEKASPQILSPADGTSFFGDELIKFKMSFSSGADEAICYLDGTAFGTPKASGSDYIYELDTKSISGGNHVFTVSVNGEIASVSFEYYPINNVIYTNSGGTVSGVGTNYPMYYVNLNNTFFGYSTTGLTTGLASGTVVTEMDIKINEPSAIALVGAGYTLASATAKNSALFTSAGKVGSMTYTYGENAQWGHFKIVADLDNNKYYCYYNGALCISGSTEHNFGVAKVGATYGVKVQGYNSSGNVNFEIKDMKIYIESGSEMMAASHSFTNYSSSSEYINSCYEVFTFGRAVALLGHSDAKITTAADRNSIEGAALKIAPLSAPYPTVRVYPKTDSRYKNASTGVIKLGFDVKIDSKNVYFALTNGFGYNFASIIYGGKFLSIAQINPGIWYRVEFVLNHNTDKYYAFLDGEYISTGSLSTAFFPSSADYMAFQVRTAGFPSTGFDRESEDYINENGVYIAHMDIDSCDTIPQLMSTSYTTNESSNYTNAENYTLPDNTSGIKLSMTSAFADDELSAQNVTMTADGKNISLASVTQSGNDVIIVPSSPVSGNNIKLVFDKSIKMSNQMPIGTDIVYSYNYFNSDIIYLNSDIYTIDGRNIHGFEGLTVRELKNGSQIPAGAVITVYESDAATEVSLDAQARSGMILRLSSNTSEVYIDYTLGIPHYIAEEVDVSVNDISGSEKFTVGNVKAYTTVTNYSANPINIMVAAAQYETATNKLIKIDVNKKEIGMGKDIAAASINVTQKTGTIVKGFAWSADNLAPLGGIKELTPFSDDSLETVSFKYPGFAEKAVTFSYDDLIYDDDPTLMSIFENYGIKSTFNLMTARFTGPQYKQMTSDEAKAMYEGFDVISHSYTHPDMRASASTVMTYDEIIAEIDKSQQDMTLMVGAEPIGYVWPYNVPNDRSDYNNIINYIKENTAIKYCRSGNTSGTFSLPDNWYEWEMTCHHDQLPSYLPQFLEADADDELLLLSVWGHSREFNPEKYPSESKLHWDEIEEYASILAEHTEIWKADNTEVYMYANAVDCAAVDYSAGTVTNNSDLDLYAVVNGLRVIIPANTTYSLKKESGSIVACWGDSLTYGQGATDPQSGSYPAVLAKLTGMDVRNMGIGGETSMTIAARQGAVMMKLDKDVVIPAEQSAVEINFSAYNKDGSYAGIITPRDTSFGGWEALEIAGTEGTMTVSVAATVPRTLNWAKYTRSASGNAVLAKKGTTVYPQSLTVAREADINIFFTGTNGGWNAANTTPKDDDAADLVDITNKMISNSKDTSKYIVIGLIGGDANSWKKTDAALYNAYGEHFVDAKKYLSSEQALSDVGITATDTDLSYISNGRVPPSLLVEDGHLNDYGYSLLAKAVYEKMIDLGYCK